MKQNNEMIDYNDSFFTLFIYTNLSTLFRIFKCTADTLKIIILNQNHFTHVK